MYITLLEIYLYEYSQFKFTQEKYITAGQVLLFFAIAV